MHRPHNVSPHNLETVRLVIAYKNFGAIKGLSHIGLGVSALNTMHTLRNEGVWTEVWPITKPEELAERLDREQKEAFHYGKLPITHVVISAPWIPTPFIQNLIHNHHGVHFTVISHSNIGFLMADPNGIKLLREATELQVGNHNFNVGGNSKKFCDAWHNMYNVKPVFLPNLYNLSTVHHVGERTPWHHGVLRIGIFGATRPLKNMVTACAAAIELSKMLKADVEIYMNSGRSEGGDSVVKSIEQLANNVPGVKIIHSGWQSWPGFRQVVAKMHLLINVSYTESYNMVCADGIAEGVASVVSEAIDWVPESWIGNVDNASNLAQIGLRLLHDRHAVNEGQAALKHYVETGITSWKKYLLHKH